MTLEGVTASLAEKITSRLHIPTIGIGAGPGCDGQIQVITDILGLGGAFLPRHAKRFAMLADEAVKALQGYVSEVQEGSFPGEGNFTK